MASDMDLKLHSSHCWRSTCYLSWKRSTGTKPDDFYPKVSLLVTTLPKPICGLALLWEQLSEGSQIRFKKRFFFFFLLLKTGLWALSSLFLDLQGS